MALRMRRFDSGSRRNQGFGSFHPYLFLLTELGRGLAGRNDPETINRGPFRSSKGLTEKTDLLGKNHCRNAKPYADSYGGINFRRN